MTLWPWYVVPTVAVLPKKEPGNEQSYKGPEKRSRGTLGRKSAICQLIADLAAIDVKVADDESEGAARRDSQISRHPNPTSARTEEKDSTNSTTHTPTHPPVWPPGGRFFLSRPGTPRGGKEDPERNQRSGTSKFL